MIAMSFIINLSEEKRSQFLQSCFSESNYLKIRLIENNTTVIPFIILLLIKLQFIAALLLTALSSYMALVTIKARATFTLPTPFSKSPFEYIVGFRSAWLIFLAAFFLAVMAIVSDNLNLGIFSIILIYLVSMSFYLHPENEFYVWIYNKTPARFLAGKAVTAIKSSAIFSLPVSFVLILIFREDYLLIILFLILSNIYLVTVILAKYASYPGQITLPYILILALSVWFPPLLLAVIPYYYHRSVKQLKEIL
jgi:hypothetical protein